MAVVDVSLCAKAAVSQKLQLRVEIHQLFIYILHKISA